MGDNPLAQRLGTRRNERQPTKGDARLQESRSKEGELHLEWQSVLFGMRDPGCGISRISHLVSRIPDRISGFRF